MQMIENTSMDLQMDNFIMEIDYYLLLFYKLTGSYGGQCLTRTMNPQGQSYLKV